MSETTLHDTFYKEAPVCPHCGHVNPTPDTYESGDCECEKCEGKFYMTVEAQYYYTTDPPADPPESDDEP